MARKCAFHEEWCIDPEEQRQRERQAHIAKASETNPERKKEKKKKPVEDYRHEYARPGVFLVTPRLWPPALERKKGGSSARLSGALASRSRKSVSMKSASSHSSRTQSSGGQSDAVGAEEWHQAFERPPALKLLHGPHAHTDQSEGGGSCPRRGTLYVHIIRGENIRAQSVDYGSSLLQAPPSVRCRATFGKVSDQRLFLSRLFCLRVRACMRACKQAYIYIYIYIYIYMICMVCV